MNIINLFNSDFLIINNQTIRNIVGLLLIFWGYFDGIKYHFASQAIRKVKSAKGNSRKFALFALGNDMYRLFYFFFVDRNLYVLITSIIALIFMIELYYTQYLYYPYRMRGCTNFKRPSLYIYFLNSVISNKIRRRL
ncbi:MAG TPA: hypothetical protein VGB37_14035 [Candidatus Lokiarchaeia archaeon]